MSVNSVIMSYPSGEIHLFGEKFQYLSNYQFCLDEDSSLYAGNTDLMRIRFSDNIQIKFFADVHREEEDVELRFTNPETIVLPSGTKISQSKIKVISQLLIDNQFHRKLRRAFYAQLVWNS